MSTYFAILTEVGEAKLANAIALGQTLKLKSLAVGDGNGNLPMPVRTQKALVHEVRRAGLNQLTIDPANTSQIIVEQVLPEDVGGWWIREIGIFDEAGDLCAVANCPPSYKPLMMEGSGRTQVVRIVLIVASTAAIELKIDPSIILATRKYVDDQDILVRAYSDEKLAKHLAAVDPHPLLAKVAYVDQQDTSARAYGDQQLAKHQAALDPHPLLAKVAYVDQQDTSTRAYGDQQLAKHQAALDPHPLLAKVAYVDQQDTSARTYGDQQLAKHQAAVDPHPLLAKVAYVDQQDTSARAYGDQQLAKHQAALDPHPLLAKVAYVDQQNASARAYVDQQDTSARTYGDQQLAKHQAALDPHPLLAKVTYVDQQDASARAYGDQQLAKHQAAVDPHPLLAKVAYVDQQDTNARTYGDQQLAKHQAAADAHPLLARTAYVDQQDASARTYGDQQLAKHQAAVDPHPLLAKVAYVDQQDTSARAYGDQQLAKHAATADPHPQYKPKELIVLNKSVAGKVDVVLTEAEAKADVLHFTGALTGSINVIVPAAARSWTVRNKTTGAYALTLKTAAAAGVALVKDRARLLYCDGSAVLSRTDDIGAAYGETPPKFDVSLRLATMEILQQRGLQFGDLVGVSGNRQLTADDIGKLLWFGGDYSVTLPPPGSLGLPSGASVSFYCTGGTGRVLAGAGARFDTRQSPVKFNVGDYLTFVVASGTQWAPIGTAQLGDSLQFSSSMTPYGHKRLPGDFLMQWTTVFLQANVPTKVSWTIAFPTALVGLWTAANNSGVAAAPASYLENGNDAMMLSSYTGNVRIYVIGH